MNAAVPVIRSIGPPPTQHAERVVGAMLRHLSAEHAKVDPVALSGRWGNPIAQARGADRMRQHPHVLAVQVTPGKKATYELDIFLWVVWDSDRNDMMLAGSTCAKPWIACAQIHLEFRHGRRVSDSCGMHFFVTHHALSRLAERCGARTPDDVLTATKALLDAYIAAAVGDAELRDEGRKRLAVIRADWRPPEYLAFAHGWAVFAPHREYDGVAVVKTILAPDQTRNIRL